MRSKVHALIRYRYLDRDLHLISAPLPRFCLWQRRYAGPHTLSVRFTGVASENEKHLKLVDLGELRALQYDSQVQRLAETGRYMCKTKDLLDRCSIPSSVRMVPDRAHTLLVSLASVLKISIISMI
jgi:hypothetical protein